ncbi:hypothetical protein EPN83_02205 [Patescibacteria group bacterium]|nr:MAG: hypothetical protein EPN83_02205 [Patescibacteria group bacterium]
MRYRTDKAWAGMIAVLLLIGIFPAILRQISEGIEPIILLVFVLLIFIALDNFLGTYVHISDRTICRTDSFILKRCLEINSIQKISYTPTFIIGRSARSLYVASEIDHKSKYIEMPNIGFTQKTIVKVVKHLKELNPKIELDENAENLIQKYESSAKI